MLIAYPMFIVYPMLILHTLGWKNKSRLAYSRKSEQSAQVAERRRTEVLACSAAVHNGWGTATVKRTSFQSDLSNPTSVDGLFQARTMCRRFICGATCGSGLGKIKFETRKRIRNRSTRSTLLAHFEVAKFLLTPPGWETNRRTGRSSSRRYVAICQKNRSRGISKTAELLLDGTVRVGY